jgi:uncharacterized membrane protein
VRFHLRPIGRAVLSGLFIFMGVAHFVFADAFVHIMPPYLPFPRALVWVSGFFELLGGIGVQLPRVRRAAGYGLVALLLAVFPANIHMALNHVSAPDGTVIPPALLWARLPFQLVFIAWVWWVAIRPETDRAASGGRDGGSERLSARR